MLKLYILTDGKNYVMDDPIHPGKYLDDVHFRKVTMDSITNEIVDIIINEAENNVVNLVTTSSGSEEITW